MLPVLALISLQARDIVVAVLNRTVGEIAWKATSYFAFDPATDVRPIEEFEKRAAKVRVKAHILLNDSNDIVRSAGPSRCCCGKADIWDDMAATIFWTIALAYRDDDVSRSYFLGEFNNLKLFVSRSRPFMNGNDIWRNSIGSLRG